VGNPSLSATLDKGCMDEAGIKLWIKRVWERSKGALLKKSSLLVLDQFS